MTGEVSKMYLSCQQKEGIIDYGAKLTADGVPVLSIDNVILVRRIAAGPLSGTVYEAMLKTSDDTEVRFKLN
jgi:hypothetical protein